jgi:hypothetical protein
MKDYFARLSPVLLVLPAIMIAYPVASRLLPAAAHAIVPDVVRTLLDLL